MIDALEVIIERKAGEAEELVAAHYGEFVTAMGELRHVQARARAARRRGVRRARALTRACRRTRRT